MSWQLTQRPPATCCYLLKELSLGQVTLQLATDLGDHAPKEGWYPLKVCDGSKSSVQGSLALRYVPLSLKEGLAADGVLCRVWWIPVGKVVHELRIEEVAKEVQEQKRVAKLVQEKIANNERMYGLDGSRASCRV